MAEPAAERTAAHCVILEPLGTGALCAGRARVAGARCLTRALVSIVSIASQVEWFFGYMNLSHSYRRYWGLWSAAGVSCGLSRLPTAGRTW